MYTLFSNGKKHTFNNNQFHSIMTIANEDMNDCDEALLIYEDNFDVYRAYQFVKLDANVIAVRNIF